MNVLVQENLIGSQFKGKDSIVHKIVCQILKRRRMDHMKSCVKTKNAPAAIDPYSRGTAGSQLVFVSGQLPIDPETGEMPATIEAQTAQSLANLRAVLEEAGSGMDKVYKTTVFLKNMDDFAAMNTIYEAAFAGTVFPARSAVEVAVCRRGRL